MIQSHRGALGLLIPISIFLAGCSATNFSLIEYEDESVRQSPQQMVMTAYMLEQRGDYRQAADLYTKALIQDPSQDVARKRLFALRNQGTQNPFEGNLIARRNAIQEAHNNKEPKLTQLLLDAYGFEEYDRNQVRHNYVEQNHSGQQPNLLQTTPANPPQEFKQQSTTGNQPQSNQLAMTKSKLQKLQEATNKPIIILTDKQYIQIKKARALAEKNAKPGSNNNEQSTRDTLSKSNLKSSTSQSETKQEVGFFLASKNKNQINQVSATSEKQFPVTQADPSTFQKNSDVIAGKVFLEDITELPVSKAKPVLKKVEKETKVVSKIQTTKTCPIQKETHTGTRKPKTTSKAKLTHVPTVIHKKSPLKLATILPKHAYPNEIEPVPVTQLEEEPVLPKTPSLEELALLLRDKSIHKKVEAAIMLSMDTSDLSYRMEILKHRLKSEEDQLVRINIAGAMLKLAPESQEAKDVLVERTMLENSIEKIPSITLTNATETVEAEKTVENLVESLKDDDPHVRAISALTLAHADENQDLAIAGLTKALNDKNVDVRIAADAALACLIKSVKEERETLNSQTE